MVWRWGKKRTNSGSIERKNRGDWKGRSKEKKEVWKVEAGSVNNCHNIQRYVLPLMDILFVLTVNTVGFCV